MTVNVSKPAFNIREKLSELDKPTGIKGTELMRSETSQEVRDLIGAGRKNKLYNGAMTISQRGSSFTSVGASANTFTLDRWKFYIQNSTARFTVSKDSESPDEFGGSMKIDCTTVDTSLASTDEVYLEQRLEGQDLQDFAKGTSSAKQYTLSFYAKTNRTGTYIVNLLSRDNTAGGVSAAYTVGNTGWNRHTVTFPADPSSNRKDNNDNGEALRVLWWFVAGSAVNSGTLNSDHWSNSTDTGRATGQINFADSTSNIFYLTGCQLEVGEKTTEFEHRSYGEELALCQRYFENVNLHGSNSNYTGGGYNRQIGQVRWKVEKRAIPTCNGPSVGNYQPGGGSGTVSIGSPTIHGGLLNTGSTNSTYPDQWINSGAILTVDAEL